MADSSSTKTPLTIQLTEPPDGSTTRPLQQHIWPEVKAQVSVALQGLSFSPETPERSLPHPVRFRWQANGAANGHARYDLHLSLDPAFEDAAVLAGLEEPQAEIRSLLLGARYYWKVVQQPNGGRAVESGVSSFVTHAAPPRWIHVPGITNVRDLGGWPVGTRQRVRQGLVFRSAEMNTHITLPPEGERVLLDTLHIRTDLDLRGTADDEDPSPALDPQRVRWAFCPLYAYKDIFTPDGKASIRRAFHVLADPASYPLLMHCWAGADRTGTLAFLLNGVLGVALADLVHDYELTSLSRVGLRLESSNGFQEILAGLRAYGSPDAPMQAKIQAYLLEAGIALEAIRRMRSLLLEDV